MEPLSALINKQIIRPHQKSGYLVVDQHYLSQVLRDEVSKVFVDEAWYTRRYSDVVVAINDGRITTASQHYALYGYYEHRMPYRIEVDERWYLSEYRDVNQSVQATVFSSGQRHFEEVGYREGRIPYANFSLRLRDE